MLAPSQAAKLLAAQQHLLLGSEFDDVGAHSKKMFFGAADQLYETVTDAVARSRDEARSS
jgi:hypothetical protein